MRKLLIPVLLSLATAGFSANAQDKFSDTIGQAQARGTPVRMITPVFSELVMLSFPAGFTPAFEKTTGDNFYINELVPAGETVENWSLMVTITGHKGLAAKPDWSPQIHLSQIAAGFKRACPETFSAKSLGPLKISGHDAFMALAGCGSVQVRGPARSEVVLMIGIKGTADYYTIQWAERGVATSRPVELVDTKWLERARSLAPIRICPRVPGEAAPFPSCANQR